MRVIVGGAIGWLFICGLFGGQAAAQTASTEPVGKPIQLLQLTHPPEAKPHERSAAKRTSKSHLAAKKSASPKLASKESTSNGAPHVTAVVAAAAAPQAPPAPPSETAWPVATQASVAESAAAVPATLQPGPAIAPPSELVIDGQTVRVASPDDANEIDLATNEQGALPAAAPAVKAASTETAAPADKSDSAAAAVSQTPSSKVGSTSWLMQVMAALGAAVAAGSVAWFLIGSAPQRMVSVSE
jgi:hypothetical protein